ncbi:ABC transporter substrate-binding protein [Balneatrix alpica]|uniref:ABC transporter substrate-binding protein n=1 Tax=Balneatrix alpica TaxID=75684 RepID=A0ABV5ZEX5_9GAMM|nr:ABC transporter substrate-binding protein [Balneatrix alpica]
MRWLWLWVIGLAVSTPLTWAETRVSLQLKWQHQFQFAGYYAALEKGYYQQAGLQVELRPAKPGMDVVDEVLSGRADFGVGNSDLLLWRQRGYPVVVLAAIMQHSPLALVVRDDFGIRNVHDLLGQRVMLEPNSAEILAYFRREQLDTSQFEWVPHSFSMDEIINAKVQAASVYITDEPFELSNLGVSHRIFSPAAAGIDFYGDNLFTREALLEQQADVVQAFRAASLKGWEYAMAHPQEVMSWLRQRYPSSHTDEHLLYEAQQMRHLVQPDIVPPGYMHVGRWRHIAQVYSEVGMLPADFELEGFLYDEGSPGPRWLYVTIFVVLLLASVIALVALYIFLLNRRLKESEQHYRLLAKHVFDVIWTVDMQGNFTYVSPSVERLRGYRPDEVIGRSLRDALCPDSARWAWKGFQYFQQTGMVERRNWELEQPCKDGSSVWTDVTINILRDELGRPEGLVGVTRDISDRRRVRDALVTRAAAIEAAAEAVVITDARGLIEHVNPAFVRMTGHTQESVIGKTLLKVGVLLRDQRLKSIIRVLRKQQQWRGETLVQSRWGGQADVSMTVAALHNDQDEVTHYVVVMHDITEPKRLEKELTRLAHYDSLTGLPNRAYFFKLGRQALAKPGARAGLIFMDLDGFKAVNDLHGHEAGDQLLQQIAAMLRERVSDSALVTRMGGDEFLLLLPHLESPLQLEQVAEAILQELRHPLRLSPAVVQVGASLGLCTYPQPAASLEAMIRLADQAMYGAKRAGKQQWHWAETVQQPTDES